VLSFWATVGADQTRKMIGTTKRSAQTAPVVEYPSLQMMVSFMVASGYGIRELAGSIPAIGRHHYGGIQLGMANTTRE
jgi:hypothetical protein